MTAHRIVRRSDRPSMEQMVNAEEPPTHEENEIEKAKRLKRLRKAMAMNDDHFGFSDDERHELAKMIPSVTGEGSWKDLTSTQLHDLITMMEGFAYINYMLSQRQETT